MVLLALPRADHLLIERDRGQFAPSRRRRMMANVRAEQPSAELLIPGSAAQPRIVSKAKIRLNSRKYVRSFKGIICADISEFESYMPRHAVEITAQITRIRSRAARIDIRTTLLQRVASETRAGEGRRLDGRFRLLPGSRGAARPAVDTPHEQISGQIAAEASWQGERHTRH
jgi:hypothetical protein